MPYVLQMKKGTKGIMINEKWYSATLKISDLDTRSWGQGARIWNAIFGREASEIPESEKPLSFSKKQ